MRWILVLVLMAFSSNTFAQGVVWDRSYGQIAETQMFSAGELPQVDNDKWHIVLFTQNGCAPCIQMKQFMQSDSTLYGATRNDPASPFIFNEYVANTQTGAMRAAEFGVNVFPTLLVVGPRGFRCDFDKGVVVFRETGFNPRDLVLRIKNAIRKFLGAQMPAVVPEPGPLPPVNPVTPFPDTPQIEPLSQSPQAVFILDPDGIGENLKVKAGQIALAKLQEAHGINLKMFAIKWEDSLAAKYGIVRADTPCVIVEGHGRKIAFLSAGALQALNKTQIDVPEADAKPDIIPETPIIDALPWSTLLGLIGVGGVPGMILGWVGKRIAQRAAQAVKK